MCVQCLLARLRFSRRDEFGLHPVDHLRQARVARPPAKSWPAKGLRAASWLVKRTLYVPLFVYKYGISPFLPKMCRYYPTCSVFMMQAIEQKGPLWGLCLGTFRLLSCNPFGGSGYDPVEHYPPYWTGKRWVWRRSTFEAEVEPSEEEEEAEESADSGEFPTPEGAQDSAGGSSQSDRTASPKAR